MGADLFGDHVKGCFTLISGTEWGWGSWGSWASRCSLQILQHSAFRGAGLLKSAWGS